MWVTESGLDGPVVISATSSTSIMILYLAFCIVLIQDSAYSLEPCRLLGYSAEIIQGSGYILLGV